MVYGSNLWAGGDQDQYVNLFKPEHIFMAGSKTNKMIHYGAQLGDVVFLAQYAPGGQPGSFSRGSQVGLSLSYVPEQGPVKLGASCLRTNSANAFRSRATSSGPDSRRPMPVLPALVSPVTSCWNQSRCCAGESGSRPAFPPATGPGPGSTAGRHGAGSNAATSATGRTYRDAMASATHRRRGHPRLLRRRTS